MAEREMDHRRRKFYISGQKSASQKPESALKLSTKRCFEEFVERSTIPGLMRITVGPFSFIKVMWIAALVCGFFFSTYQCVVLFKEFKQNLIIQNVDWEFPANLTFPAVTVCTQNPINWNRSVNDHHEITHYFLKKIEETPEKTLDFYEKTEVELLEAMAQLSESERFALGDSVDEFIISCSWNGDDCKEDLLAQNNIYFGNCFTFNHGLNGQEAKMADRQTVLAFTFHINEGEYFPYLNRDEGPAITIHQSGVAPDFDLTTVKNIFPGYKATISLTKSIVERLPEPYISKCVDHTDQGLRRQSYYYTADRPYMYSTDACMVSCLQDVHLRVCNCSYNQNVPHFRYGAPFHATKFCNPGECDLEGFADVTSCLCPKPCSEFVYNLKLVSDNLWLDQRKWKVKLKHFTHSEGGFGKDMVYLEVQFGSHLVEMSQEEPLISLAEFLSNVGGNLGLWLGISCLSIVEIIDFVLRVAGEILRYFKKKTSRSRLSMYGSNLVAPVKY